VVLDDQSIQRALSADGGADNSTGDCADSVDIDCFHSDRTHPSILETNRDSGLKIDVPIFGCCFDYGRAKFVDVNRD
jgi:hypothetical protein